MLMIRWQTHCWYWSRSWKAKWISILSVFKDRDVSSLPKCCYLSSWMAKARKKVRFRVAWAWPILTMVQVWQTLYLDTWV